LMHWKEATSGMWTWIFLWVHQVCAEIIT
jgi:hypothetical protein